MCLGEKTPTSDAQVSQMLIWDQNPLDRRRKRLLFHKKIAFWTKIRCTGVEHADFEPKSDAQMSQTVILDQKPMHRRRKR